MEKESHKSNFWQDKERAKEISQKIAELRETLQNFEKISEELRDLKELQALAKEDEKVAQELKKNYVALEKKISEEERKNFLSGPYDKGNALLQIFAGAGGQDAQDWARILLRMYQRYCEQKGWQTKIIAQSFGSGVWAGEPGIKEVTLEIKGKFAYGLLKGEKGVHRLVRLSPFSPQKLRHTSFARVDVLPEIKKIEDLEIKINPKDLKIETFRASGPGGQYVNRRESAVRITHLPTGLVASSQVERLQGLNRERAMKILYAKLFEIQKEKLKREKAKLAGKKPPAAWGHQVRSYVFQPYQMVKDLRTGVEVNDVQRVLDGELDEFIAAQVKMHP